MDTQQPRWSAKHAALVVALLAAGLVAVVPHSGLAQDPGNPNEGRPSPPGVTEAQPELSAQAVGPSYFQVPPGAFSSDGYDPDGFVISFSGGYLCGNTDGVACLAAPVNVPIGATVNGVEMFVKDDHATGYMFFYLDRINLSNGEVRTMAYLSSPYGTTSGVTKISDYSIDYPLITKSYVYQLMTCAMTNINFYGGRIGYSLGTGSAATEEEVDLPIVVNDN